MEELNTKLGECTSFTKAWHTMTHFLNKGMPCSELYFTERNLATISSRLGQEEARGGLVRILLVNFLRVY